MLSPTALVELAARRGVDVLALTDHDDISGLAEAAATAAAVGIRLVNGVEISCGWLDELSVHVLGLGIDPDNAALRLGLDRVRNSRHERARRMSDSLAAAGISDALEGALAHAKNPSLLSRSHFARFLAHQGYARDMKDVFNYYLVPGKPGYVAHEWAGLEEAIGWIRASGGMAVLAHPGRYPLPKADLRVLIGQFRDLGGEGIEVLSGSHTPEQFREYADIARQYGLAASRGSDFHGVGESRTGPGALPALAADLVPIWRHW